MDRLSELGSQLSQLTVYDIKSYYNQAKNMVLNVSEMEAKVKEATNEDPWGASSTLMQEIAQGTFNFQQFNEIMPCIYSRFMEKEARQWREIYKALQLLEYIIKHGSERVVDDARSHLSTIKMLRNFHYIDEKGKDQGLNVRNRANEIANLLVDLDKIRAERRKAKANRAKYTGIGNEFTGGSRFGGFSGDSFYESSRYGGGSGGYGGSSSSSFRDDAGRKGYEEYDAGEYEDSRSPRRSTVTSPVQTNPPRGSSAAAPESKAKEKEKAVAVDDLLGDWGETAGTAASPAPAAASAVAASPAVPKSTGFANVLDGDDFDDFQSAPVSPPPTSAPMFSSAPIVPTVQSLASPAAPVASQAAKPNLFDLLNQSKPAGVGMSGQNTPQSPPAWQQTATMQVQQPPLQPQAQAQTQAARPNYFGTGLPSATPTTPITSSTPMSPNAARSTFGSAVGGGAVRPGHAPTKSNSNFDDLWSLGLNASGKSKPVTASTGSGGGKSIKDLEREKAQAGIWGAATLPASPNTGAQGSTGSGFGSFGGSGTGAGGSAGGFSGGDDLLL